MHTGQTVGWNHPLPARLHKPLFGSLVALLLADVAVTALGDGWPAGWGWLNGGVWLLAALSLAVALARRLAWQNVGFALVTLVAGASAVELLNAHTGLPLGARDPTLISQPSLAGVVWFTPCVWLALILGGRGLARLALKPYRKLNYYGFWVMGAATAFVLATTLTIAPVAASRQWWLSVSSKGMWTWYQFPWLTLPAWGATALLLLAFVTPWLLNKQPVKQPTDWHPLAVWLALFAWLAGHQAIAQQWPALALTLTLAGGVTVLAVRGAG